MDGTEGSQQNFLSSNAPQAGAIASNHEQVHASTSNREQLQSDAVPSNEPDLKPFNDTTHPEDGTATHPNSSMPNNEQLHPSAIADGRNAMQQGTIVSELPPNDDEYIFTLKGAIQYALKQDCMIPERTLYDNCQFGRKRKTLLCWKSDGVNADTYVGKQSLDKFIRNRKAADAIDAARVVGEPESDRIDERAHDTDNAKREQQSDGASEEEVNALKSKITELEKQLVDAEVEKRAAHQARDFVVKQNENMLASFNEAKYQLGMAHNQLKALGAPEDETSQNESRTSAEEGVQQP